MRKPISAAVVFDAAEPDTVVVFDAATFAVESKEERTLSGLLLPFNAVSRPARDRVSGRVGRYTFADGTVTLPDLAAVPVILNYGHDGESLNMQIGIAFALEVKPDGVHAKFKIAKTPEGDRVLALAEAGILRFFSAEVEGAFEESDDGVRHSKVTTITGGAVVPKPAFTGAAITSVAASAAQEEKSMKCTKCGKVHAEGVTACEAGAPEFKAEDGVALLAQVQTLTEQMAELQKIKIPVGPGAQAEVREEPIYRFAGSEPAPSGFDFATDLLAAANGDQAAFARVSKFTSENLRPSEVEDSPEFVTTAGTATVNQPKYRPDMFLGQAPTPLSPLYDTFYKGSLANVTPFFWSKLDRVNTNVGVADHTEGVDPTATNLLTVVGTTVTPTPVSGKVHITREVSDQGGNPSVSALVKAEFDRSFSIALENKTAALLAAAAAQVQALISGVAAGASGITLGRAIEAGLVDLQFLPDGQRFTKAFGHVDAYKALTQAILPRFAGDTVGEKAYPIINPQNRDGVAGAKYSFIDLAGYRMEPAASLGATSANASNSWVADPSAVHVWNSGLTRLDKLQEKVEGWDVGVFAYFAGVVYDPSGLRKIPFDPIA